MLRLWARASGRLKPSLAEMAGPWEAEEQWEAEQAEIPVGP